MKKLISLAEQPMMINIMTLVLLLNLMYCDIGMWRMRIHYNSGLGNMLGKLDLCVRLSGIATRYVTM